MTGGTTDISVIEIKSSEKDGKEEINIVERAREGAFGGVFVNEKFIQWLNSIFGKETMKQFKIEHRSDYMSLIANFEEKTVYLILKVINLYVFRSRNSQTQVQKRVRVVL